VKGVAWEGPGTSSGDLSVPSRRFVNPSAVSRNGPRCNREPEAE
jgi:hypothetical protein